MDISVINFIIWRILLGLRGQIGEVMYQGYKPGRLYLQMGTIETMIVLGYGITTLRTLHV